MSFARWVGSGTLCGVLAVVAVNCLDPTEIDVVITTNVSPAQFTVSTKSAAVLVGNPTTLLTSPSTSITTGGPDSKGLIGDLVVVPSASTDDTVAVEVALGVTQDTATCIDATSDKSGCIIATRQLKYSPHHRLELPIVLDSLCLGFLCPAGETCVNVDGTAQCQGTATDCDGGKCNTTDASTGNGDAAACPPPTTLCGASCIDVQTDPLNCGECGLDCSGGKCAAGTCTLGSVAQGLCLGVYNKTVYVITAAGALETVPAQGGNPTLVVDPLNTYVDLQSIGTDVAYSRKTVALWSVADELPTPHTYSLPILPSVMQADRITVDDVGFGWFDASKGQVSYSVFNSSTMTSYGGAFPSAQTASIAAAHQVVYASIGGTTLCRFVGTTSTCLTSTGVTSVNTPGAITVSSASSMSPNVYVVEQQNSITQFDSLLKTKVSVGKGNAELGAIAYDAPSNDVYAISVAAVFKGSGGAPLTQVASATGALTRCIGLDATAVYWLDGTTLHKHAK